MIQLCMIVGGVSLRACMIWKGLTIMVARRRGKLASCCEIEEDKCYTQVIWTGSVLHAMESGIHKEDERR